MKQCDVPAAFELTVGDRKILIQAGKRYYTDDVAGAMPQYVVEEEAPPDEEPPTKSKRS